MAADEEEPLFVFREGELAKLALLIEAAHAVAKELRDALSDADRIGRLTELRRGRRYEGPRHKY